MKLKKSHKIPLEVLFAVKCLYLTLIISLISTIIMPESDKLLATLPQIDHETFSLIFWVGIFIIHLAYFFIIFAISQLKNWARVLYVILFFLWFLFLLINLDNLTEHPLHLILSMVQLILNISAIFLLFQPRATRWFGLKK
jgi:Ca2+/Na+ antiporter